jgi:hypothetical protein
MGVKEFSSFLGEEHLDFAKDEIVQLKWFVRFHTHLLSNLIDSLSEIR